MENLTLYKKLGGKDTIKKVVDNFYKRVLNDTTVNNFFEKVDMEKQKIHQTNFISFALGGPNQYTGKSLEKAHEGMNIQPEHFNAITKHLKDALSDFHVSEKDIHTVLDHVGSLKNAVLYK